MHKCATLVRSRLALLVLALFVALPGSAAVQEPQIQPAPRFVTLELRLDGKPPTRVTVREGEMATIESANLGYRVSLVPRVSRLDDDDVTVEVFAPGPDDSAGELDRIWGRRGFSAFTAAGGVALEVKVVTVAADAGPVGSCRRQLEAEQVVLVPDDSAAMRPVGGCCITCADVRTCGCAVANACGTCCGCAFCQ